MVKDKNNATKGITNSKNTISKVDDNDMKMIKMIEDLNIFLLSAMNGNVTSSMSSRGNNRKISRFDFDMGNEHRYKVICNYIPQGSQFSNLFYLIKNNANEEYLNIEDMSNITAVYEIYVYKDIDNTYEIKIKYGDKLLNDSSIPILLERLKDHEKDYESNVKTLNDILKEHNDNLKQLKNKKKKLNREIKKILVEIDDVKNYINEIQNKVERM